MNFFKLSIQKKHKKGCKIKDLIPIWDHDILSLDEFHAESILKMRVIAKRTLKQFWERHSNFKDAKIWLQEWYAEAESSEWQSPEDIKKRYRSASFLADNRVVFNVCGHHYRLIVKINYEYEIIYIRFVGTHAEYDKIDAKTI